MTTDDAISRLATFLRSGEVLRESYGDGHGGEEVGEEMVLRFADGSFVLTCSSHHTYGGHLDEETETCRTRDESGLRDILRSDRYLLIRLLLMARRSPGWPKGEGEDWSIGSPGWAAPRQTFHSLDEMLSVLKTEGVWLSLARLSAVREEAVVFRPALGLREINLDPGREVGLEPVIMWLSPLGKTKDQYPAAWAASAAGALPAIALFYRRGGPDGSVSARLEPLPDGVETRLKEVERLFTAMTPEERENDSTLSALLRRLSPEAANPRVPSLEPTTNASDPEAVVQRASAALANGTVLSDRWQQSSDAETIGIAFEIRRRADGLYERLETRWCGKPGGPHEG